MKQKILSLVMVIIVPVLIAAGCQTAKKPAPEQQNNQAAEQTESTLLELAGKDQYDQGCVSCHKKTDEADRSLPAEIKNIADHPPVTENTVEACYACHEPQKRGESLWKKFYRGMHKYHWGSEIFYGKLKGQCYSCHTVEGNGVSGIKNYPPAGDRSLSAGTAAPKTQAETKQSAGQEKQQQETQRTKEQQQNQQEQQNGQTQTQEQNQNRNELPTPTP